MKLEISPIRILTGLGLVTVVTAQTGTTAPTASSAPQSSTISQCIMDRCGGSHTNLGCVAGCAITPSPSEQVWAELDQCLGTCTSTDPETAEDCQFSCVAQFY